MKRKEFLCLTCLAAAGCQSVQQQGASTGARVGGGTVDAGPASAYAADGVYTGFRARGFFLVRQGSRLFALSSNCTHRDCRLNAEADHSFHCPCHGSNFDPNGHVTEGPAKRDLPMFPVITDARGHVMVKPTA
jgi:cytochrome b6-f complex iron-sulfur subunit